MIGLRGKEGQWQPLSNRYRSHKKFMETRATIIRTYYATWWAASYASWSSLLIFTTGELRNRTCRKLCYHCDMRNDSRNVPIRSTLHWNTVRHWAIYECLTVIQPASHSSIDKLNYRSSFNQFQPLTPATTLAAVCRLRRRQTRRTGGVDRTVVHSPPLHPEVFYIRTTLETCMYHTDGKVCIIQWCSKLNLAGSSSNTLAFT
jgi:hypothetical protein